MSRVSLEDVACLLTLHIDEKHADDLRTGAVTPGGFPGASRFLVSNRFGQDKEKGSKYVHLLNVGKK